MVPRSGIAALTPERSEDAKRPQLNPTSSVMPDNELQLTRPSW